MHIWIFNHYADSPDGIATRTFELARALTQKGHRITIFASSFSHYRLREEHVTGYWLYHVEERDGVRFVWLRGFPYTANDWRRIANMIGFGILAFLLGLIRKPKPDVIIGCSVHPCAALVGFGLSRLTNSRFIVEVPDLWPQVLIDFGRIKASGLTAKVLYAVEKLLFTKAERIIMLWRNTDHYVRSRGVSLDKVVWIPHVVDPSKYISLPDYDKGDAVFTAMYLGSFVQSMALDVILDTAQILLQKGRTDIRIVMIGEGVEKRRLMSRAERLNLSNLDIRGSVPKRDVPTVMKEANCFISCFKNSPVYKYGLSMNKTCDYMMSGRPIVNSGESAYDPVAEARAGISVKGEDPRALAVAMEALADTSPEEQRNMGRRGIAWVTEHHHVQILAARLEQVLLGPPLQRKERA
jgi:glycosyltransferase involved in cell wall biosynthesis